MKIEPIKFSHYPFIVPTEKRTINKLEKLLQEIKECGSINTASTAIKHWNKFSDELETQMSVIYVRYTLDSTNVRNKKAMAIIDELSPIIAKYATEYNKVLSKARYRKDLEAKYGKYYLKKIDVSLKAFDEKIIQESIEENKLSTRYSEILGTAQIPFRGEILNLPQIGKYMQDNDRATRREAAIALDKWLGEHDEELGGIYSKLVELRNTMAKKLGYKNYVELGYHRMGRTDYTAKEVKKYRDQIYQSVVPVCQKLYKAQMKNIGVKNPEFYDYSVSFKSGNPVPAGDEKYLVGVANKMYHALSKESGEFFDFMVKYELLDLSARPGKTPGGYCTSFPLYKSPFIFSNFNGTSGDVDVLTHEGGHAFQAYLCADFKVPEYRNAGMEACEIHSMSMEFFAYPYAKDFFGDDAKKYLYHHLSSALEFLPYGVCVDEFQHYVYENPNVSHADRCKKWKELEEKYTPHKKYDECETLNRGTYWLRQAHIFERPFYYIDYTLAQVVAFQFFLEDQKNHDKAWKHYLKYTKMGGKYPFTELLERAHLRNPFEEGVVDKAVKGVSKYLKEFEIKE